MITRHLLILYKRYCSRTFVLLFECSFANLLLYLFLERRPDVALKVLFISLSRADFLKGLADEKRYDDMKI